MVQMVWYAPSEATGKVTLLNVDWDKVDLTGLAMFVVAVKYIQEHPVIRCYQCQKMGHYEPILLEKV